MQQKNFSVLLRRRTVTGGWQKLKVPYEYYYFPSYRRYVFGIGNEFPSGFGFYVWDHRTNAGFVPKDAGLPYAVNDFSLFNCYDPRWYDTLHCTGGSHSEGSFFLSFGTHWNATDGFDDLFSVAYVNRLEWSVWFRFISRIKSFCAIDVIDIRSSKFEHPTTG